MADACGLREELECQRPVRDGPGQIRGQARDRVLEGVRPMGEARQESEVWLQPGGEAGRHVLGFAGGGAGGQGSRLPAPSLTAWPAGAGPVRSRIPTHRGDRPAQCGLGQHLPAALQARARLPPAPPRALFHLQRLRGALCLHWSRTGKCSLQRVKPDKVHDIPLNLSFG